MLNINNIGYASIKEMKKKLHFYYKIIQFFFVTPFASAKGDSKIQHISVSSKNMLVYCYTTNTVKM
jgi:hypothetical protein